MTKQLTQTLQAILFVAVLYIPFTSCIKDNCEKTFTYKLYKPVYLSFADLRSAVASEPASELKGVGKIYYKSPYIFISEVDKGIHVIDNTNPYSPQNISFINVPGNIDMAVKDNILYADSYIDLVAIDITDPMHITEVAREQAVFPQRTFNGGWMGDPNQGVITGWIEMDTTVTEACGGMGGPIFFEDFFSGGIVSTNSSGGSSGTISPGIGVSGSMARFAITENYLYCLSGANMQLFNVYNAASPVASGTVNMGWNIETLFPYNNNLFIGTTNGVMIYDNTNPSSPVYVSTLGHPTSCDPVVVQGDFAYSTLRTGTTCMGTFNQLDIIDINPISYPTLSATYPMSGPYGLGIDGENLFICDGTSGLKYYKVTDPYNVDLQQTISLGETRDVIPLGGLLLVVTTEGFYEFDYSSGTLQQMSYTAAK